MNCRPSRRIPPPSSSRLPRIPHREAYRAAYVDGLSHVLDAVLASGAGVRRVLFVSSTAVYGDAGGGWIDESTTPEPGGFSGRIIREAEELLYSRLRGTGITPVCCGSAASTVRAGPG